MNRAKTIAQTFDQQYRKDRRSGCWIWLRARKGKEAAAGGGYGCFRLRGKTVGAHKFSYERKHGRVPCGLHVMHKCHNTLCVNPKHLCLGTNRENQEHSARDARRPAKITAAKARAIKRAYARGVLQRVLAARYGLHQGDVSHIVNGHYWKHA